jgi:hypothetical protein
MFVTVRDYRCVMSMWRAYASHAHCRLSNRRDVHVESVRFPVTHTVDYQTDVMSMWRAYASYAHCRLSNRRDVHVESVRLPRTLSIIKQTRCPCGERTLPSDAHCRLSNRRDVHVESVRLPRTLSIIKQTHMRLAVLLPPFSSMLMNSGPGVRGSSGRSLCCRRRALQRVRRRAQPRTARVHLSNPTHRGWDPSGRT